MERFCTSSREYAKNIIDFELKKMLPLTKEELKSYQDAKLCYICRKRILKNAKDKIIKKSGIIVIMPGKIKVQHIAFDI